MTPEEFIREGKRRGVPKEELRRKYAALKARGAFDEAAEPAPEPEREVEGLDLARGRLGAFNRGSMLGFGDEIVGAARTAIDLGSDVVSGRALEALRTPGRQLQSIGDRYRMYRDDERETLKDYEEERGGEALALSMAGGFASPVNRVAPGWGTAGRRGYAAAGAGPLARAAARFRPTGAAVTRAAAEGAVVGVGESEGETVGEVLKDAGTGAGFAGAVSGGLRGLGRLSRSAVGPVGRRVRQRLQQQDGRFLPLSMAAGPQSTMGSVYRQVVGRIPGAEQKLQRLEEPFIEEAVDNLTNARAAVDRARRGVKRTLGARRESIMDDARDRISRIDAGVQEGKMRATERVARAVDDESAAFMRDAALEALPADSRWALEGVDLADPQAVRQRLSNWWINDAFQDVKARQFDWSGNVDKGLKRQLRELAAEDPDIALELGTAISRVGGMVERLKAAGMANASEAVPEDFVQELLESTRITAIDGDALMAMRNQLSMAANRAGGQRKGALRQVTNKIDDLIREQLGPEEAARFDEQISRYTKARAYMDATRSKGARERGGVFTPGEYATAAGKYGGRGMSAKRAPLEDRTARAAQVTARAKEGLPAARARYADAGKRAKETVNTRKREALRRAKIEEERRLERVRRAGLPGGRLYEAQDRLQALKDVSIPKTASGLSQILTAETIGGSLPGMPRSRGMRVARGLAAGRALASEGAQEFLAGQTRLQRLARVALLRGDLNEYNRLMGRLAAMEATGE